ncbi:MAG: Na+/H+ antiporter subunit D [Chloroflexota bacterium]
MQQLSPQILILLPIILSLFAAIFNILAWNHRSTQRGITIVTTAVNLILATRIFQVVYQQGPQSVQASGWPAPFGITLVADLFSAIMVLITALMGLTVAIYALADITPERESLGYHPLYHTLLMGIYGAFLTGDVFNLYVWFEVMLISSFVLIALGGGRAQLEGAFKYVTINLISSAIFLGAAGLTYGVAGTLNMADLHTFLDAAPSGFVTTLSMLFLIAFGIKAALFPLYGWLPAAYHTPPAAISAIFAGMLTKVGVYALIRVFTLLFDQDVGFTHLTVLMLAAGLTMVVGVFGAASRGEFRRILSFHIISQIGYMIMGLAIFSPLALAGAIFYIIHHIIVKTNLFLVSGVVNRMQGSYDLSKLGGLYKSHPGLGLLFLIPALSLAGIPPLSGFWAKFVLVRAGLEAEQYWIVVAALFVSVLTLYSMMKIWQYAFWQKRPEGERPLPMSQNGRLLRLAPIAILALCTIIIGFSADFVFEVAQEAANQLLDPTLYLATVLEGQ